MTEKKVLPFDRNDVLSKLWDIALWHEKKRLNSRARLDANCKARSALSGKEIRAYAAILQGLTDQELELRVRELEEKLANGILIPKTEKQT